jgi:hypothetical protein
MKNIIKYLMVAVVSLISVRADTFFSTNNLPASTNNLCINAPLVLTSITLSTTNDLPTLVKVYDGGPTTVSPLWTNYITYKTNTVSTYLSGTGTTNTVTNTTLYVLANINAAVTNATTPRVALVVTKTTPITFTTPNSSGVIFDSKLTLDTAAAGVSAVIQYRSP